MIGIICDSFKLAGTIIKDYVLIKDSSSLVFDIYQGENIVLINTKPGKVYGSLATQYLILHYAPQQLINIGVAGTNIGEFKTGDVVAVQHLIDKNFQIPEEGMHLDAFKRQMHCQALPFQPQSHTFSVHQNLCMADDSFVFDDTFVLKPETLKKIDFQAFIVAAVCKLYAQDLIVLKGISSKYKKSMSEKNTRLAFKNVLHILRQVIDYLEK